MAALGMEKRKKANQKLSASNLLWRSVYALIILLAALSVFQIAAFLVQNKSAQQWGVVVDSQSRFLQATRIQQTVLGLAPAQPITERTSRTAVIERDLTVMKGQSDNVAEKAAMTTLSEALSAAAQTPEWKQGKPLSQATATKLYYASIQVPYAYGQGAQLNSRNAIESQRNGHLMWLVAIVISTLAATLGTMFFARPMARKLSEIIKDLSGAMSRIEAQRAELQTQNLKLRDQTKLAEEQKHDLEELSRLYRNNANQFQNLFAGLPVACFAMRPNGEVYEWNSACEHLFGVDNAEALQHAPWDVVFRGEDANFFRSQFNKAMTGRPSGEQESHITRIDGEKRWILCQTIPTFDMSQNVTGVLAAVVDLTDRKTAETALAESRNLVGRMMESSPQIAYVLDLTTGQLTYANPQFNRVVGMSADDLAARSTSLLELVHPDDAKAVAAHYQNFREAKDLAPQEIEFRVAQIQGTYRWVRTREVVFLRDDSGNVCQIVGSAEDVTQKRFDEERLRLLSVVAEKAASGVIIAGPDRRILYANPAYRTITGFQEDEIIGPDGHNLLSLVVPGNDGWSALDLALERKEGLADEIQLERKDGTIIWSDISLTPVFDGDNNLTHYVAIQDDVTDRRSVQDRIRESEQRLDIALKNARSAVFAWNMENGELHLTANWNTMLGYKEEAIKDGFTTWLERVHPEDRDKLKLDLEKHLSGDSEEFASEHRIMAANGRYVWMVATGRLLHREGQAPQFIGTFTDITVRKNAERKLAESERRWNFALEASEAGVWDWDIPRESLFMSHQWKSLLGYKDVDQANTFEEWQGLVHPDDLEEWTTDIERHLSGQTDMFSVVVRLRHIDGEYRWCHDRGKVVSRDSHGKPTRMIGLMTDITEQKRASELIEESEIRFRSAIEALHEGFIMFDNNGHIQMVNPQAADILNVQASDLIGASEESIFDGAVNEDMRPLHDSEFPIRTAFRESRKLNGIQIGFHPVTINGQTEIQTWVEMNATLVYRPNDDKPYAAVAVFTDVTGRRLQDELMIQQMTDLSETQSELEMQKMDLESANEKLKLLATTDGLTGLMNHRHFQENLAEALEASRKTGDNLSVALIDVDHFKPFNDTYGHLEGDEVLRSVARILRESIGDEGIVARYGGEEFIVLLPGSDEKAAVKQIDRLRKNIEKQKWSKRQITVSSGVATLSEKYETKAEFVNDADMALYRSKEDGRNRVTHAQVLEDEKAA